MEFEWDDAKSDACFSRRGFDFAYAVRAFLDGDRIVGRDRRWDYGEDRYWLPGGDRGSRVRRDLHPARLGYPHHFGTQGQQQGGSGV